jgi:hypothetical protein
MIEYARHLTTAVARICSEVRSLPEIGKLCDGITRGGTSMAKQTALALTIGAILVALAGCAERGPGPDEVVSKYLDASLHGRCEEAYQFLSSTDKAVKELNTYVAEQAEGETPIAKALASKVSYEVRQTTRTDDHATAEVVITLPDFGAIFADVFGAALRSAFSGGEDQKDVEEVLAEKYKDKEFPMTTKTESLVLVKEADGWKVFLDWETQAQVSDLMSEAEDLEAQKKLHAAKAKYEAVLELKGDMAEADARVKELDTAIASFEEKQAYIQNVKLKNISVGKSVLGEPGVFGEVKNLGDRTLDKVEITIYCLDEDGGAVFEKKYPAVLVSDYSLFSDDEPLKPNYTAKFGVKLDDAPSEWAGKVNVAVTDIEFEK